MGRFALVYNVDHGVKPVGLYFLSEDGALHPVGEDVISAATIIVKIYDDGDVQEFEMAFEKSRKKRMGFI